VIKISVEILDVNDHSPKFDDELPTSGLTLNISESVLTGSAFSIPGAVDEDSDVFGVQGYRLTSDADSGVSSSLPFELAFEPR